MPNKQEKDRKTQDEVKNEIDVDVYEEQISMMEMVIDVDAITEEVKKYRDMYSEYKI